MQLNEVKNLIERIDMHYDTNHSKDDDYVKEWYKELKKYDSEDVNRRLEEHLKGEYGNIPPKLYFLIKNLKTPEQKIKMGSIYTNCTLCGCKLNILDFDEHYDRCSKVQFIKDNVKKYLDQEINKDEYYQMSEEDITKRWNKIANIVIQKTDNEMLKRALHNALSID